MLPAGNVLTCHKIHLTREGASHKQRVVVGGVVGEHDIMIGQILCHLAGVSEFEITEGSDGMAQELPENVESFLHGKFLRFGIV